MHNSIAITAAFRSPIGKFHGSFSSLPASDLGACVIKRILEKTKIAGNELHSVIMGHVLTGGMGQNTARQASIKAGVPSDIPAYAINQVCGSGMQSIISAHNAILIDKLTHNTNSIIIAGGQESMSFCRHAIFVRECIKMGSATLEDMMITDGLTDAFYNVHMGVTAENIVSKYNISRQEQDEFAMLSQQKAHNAQQMGVFIDEIVPIAVKQHKTHEDILVSEDEGVKHDLSLEYLSHLKPAFKSSAENGTITSGNASTINDGAAAVMLMSVEEAKKRGLEVMGVIKSFAQVGVDPRMMGTGPIPASRKALQIAGWNVWDLDCIESNEAFAGQAIHVNSEMAWDVKKVNVNGGAIAIGHPIGASGTRIVVTLIHALRKRGGGKGIATLCVGGGMGLAVCIEV